MTMKQIRALAKRIATSEAKTEALISERDELMRAAKAQGATWDELQSASGLASPTSVARALKRGVSIEAAK